MATNRGGGHRIGGRPRHAAKGRVDVPDRSLVKLAPKPRRELRCDQCGRVSPTTTCMPCYLSIAEVAELLRDHAGYSAEAVARAILSRYVLLERQSAAGQVLRGAGR